MPDGHSTEVEYRDLTPLGFPGYRVGNDGSVWSCWHRGAKGRQGKRQIVPGKWFRLKPSPIRTGHLRIMLRRIKKFVHHLVLEAFVGPCPEGMQCCHFPDRDPTNNHLSNLRWDTCTANRADAIFHGTWSMTGANNCNAKFTEADIRLIRSRFAVGDISQSQLAREYGVTSQVIGQIVRRQTWKHVASD